MSIIVIGRTDIERVLTSRVALGLVENAMRAVSRREATHLVRRILPLPGSSGILGDMPGSLGANAAFGLKCISVFPPQESGRSPHLGFLVVFEPSRGSPVAVLEAGAVTAIRTAAATSLATGSLARASARSLAIFGAGEQAEHHIPALLSARPFDEVLIWARRTAAAEALAARMQARFTVPVRAVKSAREAAGADVVCTLTSADEPVLLGEWINRGAHVNLVGSSTSLPREADSNLVARSRYFVDSRESARVHASELRFAIKEGLVDENHVLGEIGQVVASEVVGRRNDDDVTVYKSLGHIAQDLALGWYMYERALAEGFGHSTQF